MENEILLLKNKTNKKYNDTIDFILNQAILQSWRMVIDSVLILKNEIIITMVIYNYTIQINSADFDFSLCFHNRIYINHLDIQKYCLNRG